jgi:hypothetical protein
MIKDSKGTNHKELWKLFGGLKAAAEVAFITGFTIAFFGQWKGLLMLLILGVIYSIFHDCGVSYRLGQGLFYLGKGKWDLQVAKIFQNGVGWFIFKVVILIIATGTYFSI